MIMSLNIPAARSLKDKRRVIKSLIARIRNKHNASVAEVGDNDKWQICRLGASVVSNRTDHANSCLSAIVNMVEREHETLLLDYEIEIL
ncbi:MAG: DUF503 domain-containing protein [candidate division Zixibacteria bacterium]|nr:DUF503 domain-containing protein [candidate division Zixibacteria bacterium]